MIERRQRLAVAVGRLGTKAELGRRLGYKDGAFVRQMLAGERPITEKTVAALSRIRELSGLFATPAAQSTAAPTLSTAPPDLAAALPVVLGRLPGLDDYAADKVLDAIRAAITGKATLERIERDLLQWLNEPREAAPAAPSGKHQRAA